MAQIQITADTTAKTFSVTIDGENIENVVDANVYAQRDSNGNVISLDSGVYTVETMESGVRKRVSYYAEGSEAALNAIASGQTVYNDVKGFIGVSESNQVVEEIDAFLSSQKRGR